MNELLKRSGFMFITLILLMGSFVYSGDLSSKRVLFLASYHPSFPSFSKQVDGYKSVFDDHAIKLDIEYMDSKRFVEAAHYDHIKANLKYKLSKLPPYDLILLADDNALKFASENHVELFRSTPMIFCSVNNLEYALSFNNNPKITGVVEQISTTENISLIKSVLPSTKRIYYVTDNSKSGKGHGAMFHTAMKNFDDVTFVELSLKSHSFEELYVKLAGLSEGDVVFVMVAFRDKNETYKDYISSLNSIVRHSGVPVFYSQEYGIGMSDGPVGGSAISHFEQARQAALMGVSVFGGKSISDIEVVSKSPNVHVFDHDQLHAFGIDFSRLPESSIIRNEPQSFYRRNQPLVHLILILSIFIIIIMSMLLWMNQRLRLDLQNRIKIENSLRESEDNLNITLNSIGDAVIATDSKGIILRMNPVAEELTGWKMSDAVGLNLKRVFKAMNAEDRSEIANPVDKVLESGQVVGLANHTLLISRTGVERHITDSGAPIRNSNNDVVGVVLIFRDITDKYKLEEKLRQSEKMQAVGQLAGGVAHDFNNMLGGIIGSAELLAMKLPEEDMHYLNIILSSANRASELTGKLLTFSRKGGMTAKRMNVHDMIDESISIVEHSVDKRIKISKEYNADYSKLIGDRTQLENVILNLCVNARDAMPEGGELKIRTVNKTLEEAYCVKSSFNIKPGHYICITISDSGMGMSRDIQKQIFEPFFTTKIVGKGTGLGLSAVYGSIDVHKGEITVKSTEGKGTAFEILLPVKAVDEVKKEVKPQEKEAEVTKGAGKVLVIDDEDVIRETASLILEELGYDVLVAANGKIGVEVFIENKNDIDLVMLDMVMPVMNGQDCFRELKKLSPDIKVILATGYARDAKVDELLDEGLLAVVKKPYRLAEISELLNDLVGST